MSARAGTEDAPHDAGTVCERMETVVIGGGQAGLSVGYHLAQLGRPFVILDAGHRVGDAWRGRWDSLRLFTPARYDGLDGMPFPGRPDTFPTKDEMADYLEAYAERFALPIRLDTRVDSLSRTGDRLTVTSGGRRWEADNVVVAMARYQQPAIPAIAADLDPGIVQLHSAEYRSPAQLQDGGVLLAGAGNSGAEIAKELATSHPTWLSGPGTGHLPFRIEGFLGRHLLVRLVVRFLFHHVLTVTTPMGRKVRAKVLTGGGPLIRVRPKELAAAGVERVPRLTGVEGGLPRLEDGRVLDARNVVWCTGFHPGFDWIDLPVLDGAEPRHESGIVPGEPGLYFVGLHFLHALSSSMIHGVGRDARRVAQHIARRMTGDDQAPGADHASPRLQLSGTEGP